MDTGIDPSKSPYTKADYDRSRALLESSSLSNSVLVDARPRIQLYFPKGKIRDFFPTKEICEEFCRFLDGLIQAEGKGLSGKDIFDHIDEKEEKYFSGFSTPVHYKQALIQYCTERLKAVNVIYNKKKLQDLLPVNDIKDRSGTNWSHLAFTQMGSHTPTVNSDAVAKPLGDSCLLGLLTDGVGTYGKTSSEKEESLNNFTAHHLTQLITQEQEILAKGIDNEMVFEPDTSVFENCESEELAQMGIQRFIDKLLPGSENEKTRDLLSFCFRDFNQGHTMLRALYLMNQGLSQDEINDEDKLNQDTSDFFKKIDSAEKLIALSYKKYLINESQDLADLKTETLNTLIRTYVSLFHFILKIDELYSEQFEDYGTAAATLSFAVDAGEDIILCSLGDSPAYAFDHEGEIIQDSIVPPALKKKGNRLAVNESIVVGEEVLDFPKLRYRVVPKANLKGFILETDGMSGTHKETENGLMPKYFEPQNLPLKAIMHLASDPQDLVRQILSCHLNISMNHANNNDDRSAVIVAQNNS